MKFSKYNLIKKSKDAIFLFNILNTAIVSFKKNEWLYLKHNIKINKNKIQKDTLAHLVSNGFVVDNDFNELNVIKENYKERQFDTNVLGITLAPTLNCNFRCPYCFEQHIQGSMTKKNQDKFILFINKKLLTQKVKLLDIVWFGGEPLLAFSIIENLSKQLITITKKMNIRYNAYIISNGYLFDSEIIDKMQKYKIKGVQITIDGPQKIHDERRILANKQGTFKQIIENIKKLTQNKIKVDLRINLDKTNYLYIENLFQELRLNHIKNITINFGHVLNYTENCKNPESNCLSVRKFARITEKYQQIISKYNIQKKSKKYIFENINIYCGAVAKNSYTIDNNLNLYKCWNEIGDASKSVGSLLKKQVDKQSKQQPIYKLGSI